MLKDAIFPIFFLPYIKKSSHPFRMTAFTFPTRCWEQDKKKFKDGTF